MAWSSSQRRQQLPPEWPIIRVRVLKRDGHRCVELVDGKRCTAPATDVDHIRPGNDHRDSNLRSLCSWHHNQKSSREGAAAAKKARDEIKQRFRRQEEPIPAFVPRR